MVTGHRLTQAPTAAGDATAALLASHIRHRVHRYFEEFEGADVDVKLRELRQRPASRLYFFDIVAASNGRLRRRGIVVKMPLRRPGSSAAAGGRPRLAPVVGEGSKYQLEHAAMSSLQRAVSTLGEPGIDAVRVLDHLPEARALMLETVAHPTLRALTRRCVRRRWRTAGRELAPLYRRVGRLLLTFHSIPAPASIPAVRAEVRNVQDDVATYVEFLASRGVASPTLRRTETITRTVMTEIFPGKLPLVWCHGDPAPRNIFVGPRGGVAAFDVLGARRAPVYEDLGFFLTTLVSSRPQVMTQGWSAHRHPIRALEGAFLEGYFGDVVPMAEVRSYQILLLLDRWASVRSRDAGTGSFAGDRLERHLTDRFFVASLENLMLHLADLGVSVPLSRAAARTR